MQGQLAVATPAEYLARLEEPRRSEIAALDAIIREAAPQLEPFLHAGMLAYGRWHYKYASGREGDWFRIGLASNKNYISLYICAGDDRGYVAERYRSSFPKASIGKSCVRFKRLTDVDTTKLRALIEDGATSSAMT